MIPVDVYILGDVTFRGKVVAHEYFIGCHWFEQIPAKGSVIVPDNERAEWWGHYRVHSVDTQCFSGFSEPTISVRVFPVTEGAT